MGIPVDSPSCTNRTSHVHYLHPLVITLITNHPRATSIIAHNALAEPWSCTFPRNPYSPCCGLLLLWSRVASLWASRIHPGNCFLRRCTHHSCDIYLRRRRSIMTGTADSFNGDDSSWDSIEPVRACSGKPWDRFGNLSLHASDQCQ